MIVKYKSEKGVHKYQTGKKKREQLKYKILKAINFLCNYIQVTSTLCKKRILLRNILDNVVSFLCSTHMELLARKGKYSPN